MNGKKRGRFRKEVGSVVCYIWCQCISFHFIIAERVGTTLEANLWKQVIVKTEEGGRI